MRLTLLLIVVSTSAACGTAIGPDWAPSVLTLHGVVDQGDVPTPSTVRLAVLWRHRPPGGTVLGVAQELSVQAQFPARFDADLTRIPPEEAMTPGPADGAGPPPFRFAAGTLLAYDDRNGNGRLDLAPLDDTPGADVVLGAPDRTSIYYLEGKPTASLPPGLQPGFNLWVEPAETDPAPGAAVCAPTPLGSVEILPPATDIQIILSQSPTLSRLICEDRPETAPDAGPLGQPTTYQATCSADGSAYVVKRCTSSAGLCGQAWCYFYCDSIPAGSPKPAGWPCP